MGVRTAGVLLAICAALWINTTALAKTTGQGRARYTVRNGDTLLGIARAADVSVAELKALNGLRGNLIHPGQQLLLPEKKGGSGKGKAKGAQRRSRKEERERPDDYQPLGALPAAGSCDLSGIARIFLATPYRFGAEGQDATDCSGFTQQVFRLLGFELPRTAREQYRRGALIPRGEWQYGDLLFFRTYARYPSHVAIYLGEGKMIHASRSQRKVVISDANLPYFRKRFLGARRIACFEAPNLPVASIGAVTAEVNAEGMLEADLAAPGNAEGHGAGQDCAAGAAPLSPTTEAPAPAGGAVTAGGVTERP